MIKGKPKLQDMELIPDSPMFETLMELESTLRKHFEIIDWQGVRIILATAMAHFAPGEMVWVRVIGPSRSGKTELLGIIAKHTDCERLEVVTPAAIRGGLKGGPKVLKRLNDKLVITKDMATLLTIRSDTRTEIFGLLRPIKDGELVADFGSEEGHLAQTVKFDWIIATTPHFEQHRQLESLLGERFIDLRWRPGKREEMAYKAGLNNPFLSTIRSDLGALACSLMDRVKSDAQFPPLSDSDLRTISGYADKAAILRTPVPRDRFRNVTTYPEPEIGTDLTQGFSRIVQGLSALGIDDYEPYLNRLMWDSMQKMRSAVVKCLVNGEVDADAISKAASISKREVAYILDDLKMLHIVDANNLICMQLHIDT